MYAVGRAVGLNLPRQPFYLSEAEFVVSCSYGPGRYDPGLRGAWPTHYPAGFVRWTEQARNMQAGPGPDGRRAPRRHALCSRTASPSPTRNRPTKLIEGGKEPLPRHRAELSWRSLPSRCTVASTSEGRGPASGTLGAVGCLSARRLPAALVPFCPSSARASALHHACSAPRGGLVGGRRSRLSLGFDAVATDEDEVFGDPSVGVVFSITAAQSVSRCPRRQSSPRVGKHIFVEKPLALTLAELDEIEAAPPRGAGAAAAAHGSATTAASHRPSRRSKSTSPRSRPH